ncbi:MAG: CDP-alcohol phosphatidyltransferase family protein [Candidatus Marinimicrobia bacterium]|jgi:CDP-diacylglycerol--glycerol-3-phosphate 3-phosphatidyltransferase|nr:CDP-alcohol phosphatidyltransferase family protein [Candidatus Neomarinimicrobiota bacterium]MDP6610746.1 CDP-alcohol phosphatidyltransferase family protein [Candidatus Neomarinimicrobiota bacterium]|tara:strand:- start:15932 stop:16498 length:567 start_codon:yes stop_codon:yes gene_type:complete
MLIKTKLTDPTRILTLANMISIGRAVLAVPIIYTLRDPALGTTTFSLIVLAVLSDALDGWVARKAHEVTHFGKWIDPIADFACILSVISYLTLVGRFPGWFFVFYLVRYVVIALPAVYLLNHDHFILSANWWGKWAAGITALAVLVHIWPWEAFPWMQDVTIYISTFLLSVSWIVYFKTFFYTFKEIR